MPAEYVLGLASATTRDELAVLLGTVPRTLRFLLYRLSRKRAYRTFELKKRGGGVRKIRAPCRPLKLLQEEVAALLEVQYQPKASVFGYVKARNIQMNAQRHAEKRWVLRVDLKDFFPSINFGRVRGLFLNEPFSLAPEVATTLAQICCFDNQLPQGSPASPIISNIICRGMDHELGKLARTHRCTYSRYCDDLIFSTNRRSFPSDLARYDGGGKVLIGPTLAEVLKTAGFVVNPDKVQLRPASQRQMVTGLIVNTKVNVPRKFVRELRMLLHVWRKLGSEAAAAWYAQHDKRNRAPGKGSARFSWVVRGKLQYLGSVRGWTDPQYLRLAGALAKLDPTFKVKLAGTSMAHSRPAPTLRVFVEGHTDKDHIESALAAFQRNGRFKDLVLEIDGTDRGADALLTMCTTYKQSPQRPCLFVFDGDRRDLIPKVTTDGDFKDWGNNVFSMVVPKPNHRPSIERWAIEHLYIDADIGARDADGRRLYLSLEFDSHSGFHRSGGMYWRVPSDKVVVEDHLFDTDEGTRVPVLSKSAFARLMRERAETDFGAFLPVLEMIMRVRDAVMAIVAAE